MKGDKVVITPQSIFNAAWQRFIIEKRLPCVKDRQCAYEHKGNNCAVGAAMTREQLDVIKMCCDEHETADKLAIKHPTWFYGEPDTFYLLQARLHDRLVNFDVSGWKCSHEELKQQYEQVAEEFDLTIPEETNV